MIRTLFKYSLGLISLVLAFTQTCDVIDSFDYDYESYPNQPFDFEHAELRVTLEPDQNLVRGIVTYTIAPKIDGITELILQTEESAIDEVLLNEMDVEYSVSQDSLIILLPDSSIANHEFSVEITWQSNSSYGLYTDYKSNFRSAKNPISHRHWLPGFDHPRNELTFDAYFTIPYETEVLFNGELVSNEMKSATMKEIHYQSNTAVPFTGLGFAMGDYMISEVTSGLTSVRLFASELGFEEEERVQLIRVASQLKKDIEKALSMEYPWEGLNIVVLPDNYWEERIHGSGTIFLYENLGSLSNQLKRGLYTQWFGEYQRSELFFDRDEVMKTALHYSLFDDAALIDNPDSLLLIEGWNVLQNGFTNESDLFQSTIKNSLEAIVRKGSGIFDYDDYSDVWYQETGISWKDKSIELVDEMEVLNDSLAYTVDVVFDEFDTKLDLYFVLTSGNGEEINSLKMTEITFQDTITHEVDFTGLVDTVSFQLDSSVEYVRFDEGSISLNSITFDEFPLYFLLSKLRSERSSDRILAATLLANYSDNPDLQLALNDVMSAEQNGEVRAALLFTMASITSGATGTEQQFLSGLNNSSLEIQESSLKALANYPDDEMVKNAIRNKVLRTESNSIFELALKSYSALAKPDDIVSLAQRLQRVDSTGMKSLFVMNSFSEADSNGVFISLSEDYLSNSYSYDTRSTALTYLLENDTNEESWVKRISELIEDNDPRIRYISLESTQWMSAIEALKVLTAVTQDESDIRVLIYADELLDDLSE